jgi:tRNA(Ile)-lysidine synthase TilS/MesJ
MRQHRLALCKGHYLDWLPEQIEKFIKKYSMFTLHDRILVAVSGGKDSLALWDVLIRLGYQADGLYIGLGIEGETGYSEQSNYGLSIPEMSERTLRGKKPCSVCGLTKRHVMNRVARDGGYNVLATGHNLDDEAAVLFGNTLQWLSGYLVRQGPVLEANHRIRLR